MANICDTTIAFVGNEDEITTLYNKIQECISYDKNDDYQKKLSRNWLGNILIAVGLGELIDSYSNKIYCRGIIYYVDDEISSYEESKYYFKIDTETAWVPMIEMWRLVINKLGLKSIDINYKSTEPGCGLYVKYDMYDLFPEEYNMEAIIDNNDRYPNLLDLDEYNDYTQNELIEKLNTAFDMNETSIELLLEKVNEYNTDKALDGYGIYVNRYEVVDGDSY
jgi:hypothetical protein